MESPVMEGLAHQHKPPKKVKDMRKHGIAETHIVHHHDGTHHITHHHVHPGMEPSTHGAQDLEELCTTTWNERLGGNAQQGRDGDGRRRINGWRVS